MKKLVIFGDSILRGVTYSGEEHRHRLCLGHKLNRVRALGLDIENHSRMGATVPRSLDAVNADIGACDEDTLVLFELGGNDCDYDWAAVSARPEEEHLPHTPEKDFLQTYADAIRRVKATGAKVVVSSLVPIDPERYFTWIANGKSPDNIAAWLGDVSMLYRYQEHYNHLVEKLAEENGCPILNLREAFLLSHHYKDLLSPDGIHPTEAGHALIETTMCAFLSKEVVA